MTITTKILSAWKPALAGVALTSAVVGLGAAPASAVQFRGVDMNRACKVQHGAQYTSHVGNHRDVFSWYCHAQDRPTKGIDVAKACVQQYGWGWRVGFRDRYNAFSWYCWR